MSWMESICLSVRFWKSCVRRITGVSPSISSTQPSVQTRDNSSSTRSPYQLWPHRTQTCNDTAVTAINTVTTKNISVSVDQPSFVLNSLIHLLTETQLFPHEQAQVTVTRKNYQSHITCHLYTYIPSDWSSVSAVIPSPLRNCVRLSKKLKSTQPNTPCRHSACRQRALPMPAVLLLPLWLQ